MFFGYKTHFFMLIRANIPLQNAVDLLIVSYGKLVTHDKSTLLAIILKKIEEA